MVENSEYAQFMRRAVRAFVRRAADDPDSLPLLAAIAEELDQAVNAGILAAHEGGFSTAEIAARLGITRQAVHQRILRQRRLGSKSGGTGQAAGSDPAEREGGTE